MRKFLLVFGAISLFITAFVQAQNDRAPKVSIPEPAQDTERRVALVIGNASEMFFIPSPVSWLISPMHS